MKLLYSKHKNAKISVKVPIPCLEKTRSHQNGAGRKQVSCLCCQKNGNKVRDCQVYRQEICFDWRNHQQNYRKRG